MSNLGDMKSRIYSEIHQTLSTVVQNAVLEAVEYYKDKRFWFNEAQVQFNMSLTTMYALNTVIPDLINVDTFKVYESNNPFLLNRVSWMEIESWDFENSTSSAPSDYSIHHEMLRIYPTPSQTVTAVVSYHKAITMSASNSSSTVWTNEAEQLIRYRAKGLIYATVLLDPQQAQIEQILENQALMRLFSRTMKRQSDNKVKRYL